LAWILHIDPIKDMKRFQYIISIAILVILANTIAFSDTASIEVKADKIRALSTAKFEHYSPATQTNQSGISPYQKIFNVQDVNLVNGSVDLSQVDLAVPGRNGLDLVISRSYNSRDFSCPVGLLSSSLKMRIDLVSQNIEPDEILKQEKESPKNDRFYSFAGHGWEFNFCARLIAISYTSEDGDKLPADQALVQMNGSSVRFEEKDGLFKPVDRGIRETIRKEGTGYVLINNNGIKYYFKDLFFDKYFLLSGDIPGQQMHERYFLLGKIEDPYGNCILFKNEAFGSCASGKTIERKADTRIPSLTDLNITYMFYAHNVDVSLPAIGAALINPMNWFIPTLVINFVQLLYLTPKTRTYWETAGYSYTPIRPTEIADSCGRTYHLEYNSDSQISRIQYLGSNNEQIYIDYLYNNGNLARVRLPEGHSTIFEYSSFNQGLEEGFDDNGYLLTQINYPSGAKAGYEYSWFCPTVTDPKDKKDFSFYLIRRKSLNGITWTYEYSGGYAYNKHCGDPDDGRLWSFENVRVTDPLNNNSIYKVVDNLIEKAVDPAGNEIVCHWDTERKQKVEATQRRDNRTCKQYFKYDDFGNNTMIIDLGDTSMYQDDRNLIFEYAVADELKDLNITGRVSHSFVESGINRYNDAYFAHNNKGGLISVKRMINGREAIFSCFRDGFGNVTKEVDPLGNSTEIEYGSLYRNTYPTKVTRGGLTTQRTYYFTSGLLKTEYDNNNLQTSYKYDLIGRVLKKTNPDGSQLIWDYRDDENRIYVTDEMDHLTIYTFNDAGGLIEITYPDSSKIGYDYDNLSRLTTKTDQLDRKTGYRYDPAGRLTKVVYPDGSSKQLEYKDNSIAIIDELGNKWTYCIDGRDNVIKVIEPNGRSVNYEFDCMDDLTRTTDQKYHFTNYLYDSIGNILQIKRPDGSAYSYEYDLLGQKIKRTDADSRQTSYLYDLHNRIIEINYSDPKENIKNVFDSSPNGKGKLSTVNDTTGSTEFEYDKMGRTISQAKLINNIRSLTGYNYDEAGNLIEITYPFKYKVRYTYDTLGCVREAVISSIFGERTIASFECLPNKTIKKIEYLNKISQSFEYDQRDKVTKIIVKRGKDDVLLDYTYEYDASGNLTAFKFSPSGILRYEYDNLGRLIRVKYPSESDSVYSYDETGNRKRLEYAYGSMDYSYDPATDRLKVYKLGGIEAKLYYDGCGNEIGEEKDGNSRKLLYNGESRVIEASTYNHNLNHHLAFSYDFKGQMAARAEDNSVEICHYDQNGNLIAVTDDSGRLKACYVYVDGSRICRINADDTIYYYVNDPLGSPILLIDQWANVLNRYVFDPFGGVLASKENAENDHKFTGKEYFGDLDLYHFGERLYNPITGRFLGEDKAGPDHLNPQSLNRYIYCLNNPFKYIDPDGLESYLVHGIWAGNLKDAYALKDSLIKKGVPDVYMFEWSKRGLFDIVGDLGEAFGELSGINRSAASRLADYIASNHQKNEPINIIAHSAGCRISINAAKILDSKYKLKVDRLFMMAGPIGLTDITNIDKSYNMMSFSLKLTSLNDSPVWDIAFPYYSIPSYLFNWNKLEHVTFKDIGHTGWFSSPDVENFLLKNVKM